jgi:hypothetical protein
MESGYYDSDHSETEIFKKHYQINFYDKSRMGISWYTRNTYDYKPVLIQLPLSMEDFLKKRTIKFIKYEENLCVDQKNLFKPLAVENDIDGIIELIETGLINCDVLLMFGIVYGSNDLVQFILHQEQCLQKNFNYDPQQVFYLALKLAAQRLDDNTDIMVTLLDKMTQTLQETHRVECHTCRIYYKTFNADTEFYFSSKFIDLYRIAHICAAEVNNIRIINVLEKYGSNLYYHDIKYNTRIRSNMDVMHHFVSIGIIPLNDIDVFNAIADENLDFLELMLELISCRKVKYHKVVINTFNRKAKEYGSSEVLKLFREYGLLKD